MRTKFAPARGARSSLDLGSQLEQLGIGTVSEDIDRPIPKHPHIADPLIEVREKRLLV